MLPWPPLQGRRVAQIAAAVLIIGIGLVLTASALRTVDALA